MVGGQVMIIYVGGKAFNVVHLNGAQWAYSIILGFFSIPIGACLRLIPDEFILSLIPDFLKGGPKGPELLISDEEEHFRFPKPLADVKEELSFLKKVKGGRLNNLKFAMQQTRDTFLPRSRSSSHSRNDSNPQTPVLEQENSFGSPVQTLSPESRRRSRSGRSRSNSALGATAVMAGIIAGSVAGWSPIERTSADNDNMGFPRSRAKSDLETRDGILINTDTTPNDQAVTESPQKLGAPASQVENGVPNGSSTAAESSTPSKSSNGTPH